MSYTLTVGGTEFQSTHPRGVRPLEGDDISKPSSFQSTHPRGVRPAQAFMLSADALFQSTHPRGVRLLAPYLQRIR